MFSFRASNFFCLIPAAIFALNDAASANTCTDAVFKLKASIYTNQVFGIYIDSIYIKENTGDEDFQKFYYSNEKLDSILEYSSTKDNNPSVEYFYNDTNETILKNRNHEIISKDYSTQDTICFHLSKYNNGIKNEISNTTKATDSYIATIEYDDESYFVYEYFLQKDSVIEVRTLNYRDYGMNDTEIEKFFYIADKEDDFKCSRYNENGVLKESTLYVPNHQGYSLKITSDYSFEEIFFINNQQKTTSIRKTLKPVKISPRARYFDLLGRYKFTK